MRRRKHGSYSANCANVANPCASNSTSTFDAWPDIYYSYLRISAAEWTFHPLCHRQGIFNFEIESHRTT